MQHGDAQPLLRQVSSGAAGSAMLWEGRGSPLCPASRMPPVLFAGWHWQFSIPTPMATEVTSPVLGSVKPTFLTYFSSLRSGGAVPSVCLVLVALLCAGWLCSCRLAGYSSKSFQGKKKPKHGNAKSKGNKEHLLLIPCSQQCPSHPVRSPSPAVKGKTQPS